MAFEYYTFPVVLLTIAFAMYFWQEPRMKSLENGRKRLLKKLINDLFGSGKLDDARAAVHKLLHDGYMANKDLLMPIQKFLPYSRIRWFLGLAMLFATISALFHATLSKIYIVNLQMFSVSANDIVITVMLGLCALPSWWLYDEFRYMKRIIDLFDNQDEQGD